jgi:hypothetical protein
MIKIDEITEIEIKDNVLTINQFDNNQVILNVNSIKNILEAINYTHCCKELKDDIKFERKSSARVFNNEKGIWESI